MRAHVLVMGEKEHGQCVGGVCAIVQSSQPLAGMNCERAAVGNCQHVGRGRRGLGCGHMTRHEVPKRVAGCPCCMA